LKALLAVTYPDRKPNAYPVWAGTLGRFRDEIKVGDVVVAPYKPDSTINIGVVTGEYRYETAAQTHRHRRDVRWVKVGLSRTVFTQPALYELGAFLAVFRIKKYAHEFEAVLGTQATSDAEMTRVVETVTTAEPDVDSVDEPRASRIDRHTRDFVLDALVRRLNPQEFEEFTADLLRALGYQARVTQFGGDGGVDVHDRRARSAAAHRHPAGARAGRVRDTPRADLAWYPWLGPGSAVRLFEHV